jgi:hypothetical protein
MALNRGQRSRILELLERLDTEEVGKILQSQASFMDWLRESANDIYVLIANNMQTIQKGETSYGTEQ